MKLDDDIIGPLELEHAWGPAVVVRKDRQIVRANSLAEQLLGYGQGELEGQKIDILIPAEARERHAGHMDAYFDRPRARQMGVGLQVTGLKKGGVTFTAEVALTPIAFKHTFFAIAIIREIDSNKKWLEQSLAHAQRVIDRLESKLNK